MSDSPDPETWPDGGLVAVPSEWALDKDGAVNPMFGETPFDPEDTAGVVDVSDGPEFGRRRFPTMADAGEPDEGAAYRGARRIDCSLEDLIGDVRDPSEGIDTSYRSFPVGHRHFPVRAHAMDAEDVRLIQELTFGELQEVVAELEHEAAHVSRLAR